ncbi:oxidoreductase [Altericroceibacterium endophyticum]|uniref:SDR family NAD(P)-dependent oxidoreductase n=1 Tax=Altericroceibacterium endophyticum TaxID=1808508 RepID=A0A6I4T4E9_9SPHN|nr:oxidoreductase [Altericroceibacterium endophyticum]MXO65021.1 SDR family NAD(P)-dependent oxidoreductase [Altericroceibacterium endophyticum]
MTNWIITGINSGFGAALSKAVLARGDMVAGTARRAEDRAAFEALAPGRAFGIALDLADPAGPSAAIDRALEQMGRIDVLVNNAGYGMVGAIEETSDAEARALFDVNLFGPMAMIRAVLPHMRERKAGRIVNITSLSGFAPWAGTGIYGASKYALECIGQTLAQEVEPLGITVTNVAPGGFRTGFAGRGLAQADKVIADYAATAHNSKASLAAGQGQEKGDPERAAQAILAALEEPEVPRHLFLGEDALRHTQEQIDLVTGEMAKWRELSLSTDFTE